MRPLTEIAVRLVTRSFPSSTSDMALPYAEDDAPSGTATTDMFSSSNALGEPESSTSFTEVEPMSTPTNPLCCSVLRNCLLLLLPRAP